MISTIPSMAQIVAAVADISGVSAQAIQGTCRARRYTPARHLAMAACREMTANRYPDIAQFFGKKNHTTVLYGEERARLDPDFASQLQRVRDRVGGKIFYERDIA